jgi:hypothetical protein
MENSSSGTSGAASGGTSSIHHLELHVLTNVVIGVSGAMVKVTNKDSPPTR